MGGKGGNTMVVADTWAGDKPTDASVGSSAPTEAKPKEPPPVLTANNGAEYEGNEDPRAEAVRYKMALSRARQAGMQLPITRMDSPSTTIKDGAPCQPVKNVQ